MTAEVRNLTLLIGAKACSYFGQSSLAHRFAQRQEKLWPLHVEQYQDPISLLAELTLPLTGILVQGPHREVASSRSQLGVVNSG